MKSSATEDKRQKRELLIGALAKGAVRLDINPNAPGVRIPPGLAKFPTVFLFIADEQLTDPIAYRDYLGVTLNHDNQLWRCVIPYEAIWALTTDAGRPRTVWIGAAPDLVAISMSTHFTRPLIGYA